MRSLLGVEAKNQVRLRPPSLIDVKVLSSTILGSLPDVSRPHQTIYQMIGDHDKDGSGTLDFQEFKGLVAAEREAGGARA